MNHDLKPYPAYKDSGVPWLGKVPEHWESHRLKGQVSNINEQTNQRYREDIYLALENVESWTGKFRAAREDVSFDSQVKRFRPGDVLFGKLRPYLAKVACPDHNGVCVSEFLVLRPKTKILLPNYLEKALCSKPIIDTINSSTFGAKMPRANWQFIGGMTFPLPPLPEQTAIVRYLAYMDRRIRCYIRAKQKLIRLLEEQKQSIIHEVVTGRVNVRTGQPYLAYKPSGIEWLGEVPEHWEISRSKRLFSVRNEFARPDDIQLSATQAYGVIPQAEYEEKIGRRVVKIFLHLDKRRHVEKDDFVISMRSFQGGLERAWTSGCIRSSYVVLKSIASNDVEFFAYLFKSHNYIQALRATANFIRDGQDLNFHNFSQVDLPVIPPDEQKLIAEFLSRETANIVRAISRTQREITLLREYHTRLIADVVTGKLDVRQAAAGLPEEVAEPELLDEEADIDADDATEDDLGEEIEEEAA